MGRLKLVLIAAAAAVALCAATSGAEAQFFFQHYYYSGPFIPAPGPVFPAPFAPFYGEPYPAPAPPAYGRNCDTQQGVFGPIRARAIGAPCRIRRRNYGWLEGETVP